MTQDLGRSRQDREAVISSAVAKVPDLLLTARETYKGRLKLLADELLSSCSRAPDDPQALAEFKGLVHRLTGTAGSYGFPLISEAADAVGQMLEVSAPGPSVVEWTERLAERMREAGIDIADEA